MQSEGINIGNFHNVFRIKQFENGNKTISTGLYLKDYEPIWCGDNLKYTYHKGYNMKSQIITVVYDSDSASFGYFDEDSFSDDKYYTPFSRCDEIYEDVLNYCEYVGNVFEDESYD